MSDVDDPNGSMTTSLVLPTKQQDDFSSDPIVMDLDQENFDAQDVGERGPGDGREENVDDTDDEDNLSSSTANITVTTCKKDTPDKKTEVTEKSNLENISHVSVLPWGSRKERELHRSNVNLEMDLRPGEFVMRVLVAKFTEIAEEKIESVMTEPIERLLSKSLQRGEDPKFDQLLSAFGNVGEHCLPSLLRTLFAWYGRQGVAEWGSTDHKYKNDPNKKSSDSWTVGLERELLCEKRDLAVDFIFCLALIEVLKQLPVHPGHDDLIKRIEDVTFKHFKYREYVQNNPNGANINIIADLYAEVAGVLAQSRFQCVRRHFMSELKELRAREPSTQTTQSIISLLMGMKFFRVKMVPIEEFEASFQFMQECAQYFLEVRDKDIKHALAGLFVEILVPVAAAVKNEVNVPCLKNFVDMLYSVTQDMATKNKHKLAIFPLVTCLLCVSQKTFFLSNWHYFLAMCLQHLKNRDPKMSRVALESLYRLLWVYMIRIKCESNSATHSRLASIVNSLFPKGSKAVVPRDTPLNIFVKIIQFIAQERLDFAMREIVFDLLSVGRQFKFIITPERMSIGLRAFLVVADSLQQKEGDPPMPRTVGPLPSGNTLRVKKTFLNKMLTEETAKNIGLSSYYSLVRKSFNDILKALDSQFGKPLMMTNTQNINKEPDEMITGERKPKIDLFRTCVAAVPRLIPDGMSGQELVELFSRLTVHMDEELRGLSFQSLQNLVIDFPEWRHDVVFGFIQFLVKEVSDTNSHLLDNGLRMLLQLLSAWKNALGSNSAGNSSKRDPGAGDLQHLHLHQRGDHNDVLRMAEAFALTMLCSCRQAPRRVAVAVLKEVKSLAISLVIVNVNEPVIDVMDRCCSVVLDSVVSRLPAGERMAISSSTGIDLQWLADRNSSIWTGGFHDDSRVKSSSVQHLVGPEDVWPLVLVGFLQKDRLFCSCPLAVAHVWPIVYTRINSLYSIVDPVPVSENRASLLRSATQMRKPVSERDMYLTLWRNYIVLACCVVPAVTKAPVIRCISPDISLGSSPDSGAITEKSSDRTPQVAPQSLYKMLVPLVRCDVSDIRDTVTLAMGNINHLALSDLMEELLPYIRESIDRNKENMRRRKRRDILRLHLVKLFEMCAEQRKFALCETVLDPDNGNLQKHYLEYMDGARTYLEGETDKDNFIFNIKMSFCNFVRKLIGSFSLEQRQTLMPRSLRKSLFYLFTSWSGSFGTPFASKISESTSQNPTELEMCALHASSTVVCCGPCFDTSIVNDEGHIYQWLQNLFNATDDNIKRLAEETVIQLLEFNPDCGTILDWVVDQCYVASPFVADRCFNALATIFSAREYPCDHYTAVLTVTLLNTGCPRAYIQETALQLLQILDKRFFGAVSPIDDLGVDNTCPESSTLDVLLSASYSRSQLYLSKQLSVLHPEFTMPIFSEITYRLQTAGAHVRQLLFQCMLPWLYNMELVEPSSHCNSSDGPYYDEIHAAPLVRREGWGSAEATEMVLNNLFYITVKFGDEHAKEIEDLWAALSTCWPNNLRVIIRYLFIITGVAPYEVLAHAKRVTVYVGRAKPDRLVEELMTEMGTVETLNCVIERTETPPFFRLTSMRKTSSHGEGGISNGANQLTEPSSERGGVIHTKRHSGEQEMSKEKYSTQISKDSAPGSVRSVTSGGSVVSSVIQADTVMLKSTLSAPSGYHVCSDHEEDENNSQCHDCLSDNTKRSPMKNDNQHFEPHPLPMPEYGGYFAPLTEYLPDSSQPITAFHRCNLAVMLICDVIVAGIDVEAQNVDWSIHVPLMLHVITLGLDHAKPLVHEHCKILLVHLLTVVANHRDHLGVARVLLNNKTTSLGYGLLPHNTFVHSINFTEEAPQEASDRLQIVEEDAETHSEEDSKKPTIVTSDETDNADTVSSSSMAPTEIRPTENLQYTIKSLINFIIESKSNPLWSYEDITSKQFIIRSADQLSNFVRHIVSIFSESVPHTHIEERMAQIALHLALSCSSRHYAGRSLQVFRCLRVSLSSRMLSELLGRLVETVAEQGEDMQGYVTELMLTLEAAVEALHSDFRPIEFVRELFKSTPNLNNKERRGPCNYSILNHYYQSSYAPNVKPLPMLPIAGHFRSTSSTGHCAKVQSDGRGRSGNEVDVRLRGQYGSTICKSRSAQSLKNLADSNSADDKMTVLAQLFWIAVSILESEYDYEFLLAMRLLNKVLCHLSIDRPDCRDKVDKLQQQLKWRDFPGVHALLLKGCTTPVTYEPTIALLTRFTQLTDLHVVDPVSNRAFAMNVMALLPYMLLHYEDATELCIQAAENIAQECGEKGKQLENLATVMTLYSRRNFSKESFQWTKCVVKYLHDSYEELTPLLMAFLVEVLEKGPTCIQNPILNILHCMLHYIDMNAVTSQLINGDLMNAVAKHIEGVHWKEALRILKLAVTKSSALVVPPAHQPSFCEHLFTDVEGQLRKELPGRTMEFTFDVTQTPVIARRFLSQAAFNASTNRSLLSIEVFNSKSDSTIQNDKEPVSPQRSLSISDGPRMASWKRPWLSQARVRERLVNLLSTCGQRVGLPKSPSVIFSQSSELERQSSMASSTEEVSVAPADSANDRTADDMTSSEKQFAVFKDFDFLEYELESQGGESIDNFNLWGVRRRSPGNQEDPLSQTEDFSSERNAIKTNKSGEWWDEEVPTSLIDESSSIQTDHTSAALSLPLQPQLPEEPLTPTISAPKLKLDTEAARAATPASISDHSESSEGDIGDTTPCNASPGIGPLLLQQMRQSSDLEETWRHHVISIMSPGHVITSPHHACGLFNSMYMDCVGKFNDLLAESSHYFSTGATGVVPFIRQMEIASSSSSIPYVFVDTEHLTKASAMHKFRSTLVALHEHFETFWDKQDHAFMCLDSIKSTLKLQAIADSSFDIPPDDQQIDLYRGLYKVHFQLFLLYDTYTSFFSSLLQFTELFQLSDHSIEVGALQMKLFAASEELNATPPSTPSRRNITPIIERPLPEGEEGETESIVDDSETSMEGESTLGAVALEISEDTHSPTSFMSHTSSSPQFLPMTQSQANHQILQLVADQEWLVVLQFVRRHRLLWSNDSMANFLDDVTIILNIYCSYLSDKKAGMIAVCCTDTPIDEVSRQLTEANMAALSVLRTMEEAASQNRGSSEFSLRKTEC